MKKSKIMFLFFLLEILAIFKELKNERRQMYQFLDNYCTCPTEMAVFQKSKDHGGILSYWPNAQGIAKIED